MSTSSTSVSNDSTLSNFTANPAILNQSDLNDTSFGSTYSSVPLTNLNNSVPELHGLSMNKGSSLKKKLYPCITLLILVSCLSLLIFLSVKISGYVSLAGNVEGHLDIPGLGGFGGHIKAEEVLNFTTSISTGLSSQLSQMEPKAPFQLWDHIHMNLKLS